MLLTNKGFGKITVFIVIIVLLLTGISIAVYEAFFRVTTTAAIEMNISNFRGMVKQYVTMNGYSTMNISAKNLQSNGLIPANWTTKGNWTYPLNQDIVQGYWIGHGYNNNSFYGFGFKSRILTNKQAYAICHNFENSIDAVGYDNKWYLIKANNKCGKIIPKNDSLIPNGAMYLSFE